MSSVGAPPCSRRPCAGDDKCGVGPAPLGFVVTGGTSSTAAKVRRTARGSRMETWLDAVTTWMHRRCSSRRTESTWVRLWGYLPCKLL